MIGYWHDTVVRQSVVDEVSEQENRSCPQEHDFIILQLSTPTPTLSSQPPYILKHTRSCHLASTLKYTMNKRTAKMSTSGINNHRHHDARLAYSSQHRTIGSFSATAELLVKVDFDMNTLFLFVWIRKFHFLFIYKQRFVCYF